MTNTSEFINLSIIIVTNVGISLPYLFARLQLRKPDLIETKTCY